MMAMIYRISIQATSQGIDREVYSLSIEPAEDFLSSEGFKCVRTAGPGESSLWVKNEPETVFNAARMLKAQIFTIKTID
jgi:hypothetical protein